MIQRDDADAKLQHWHAFPAAFGPNAAPVLEFHFALAYTGFTKR